MNECVCVVLVVWSGIGSGLGIVSAARCSKDGTHDKRVDLLTTVLVAHAPSFTHSLGWNQLRLRDQTIMSAVGRRRGRDAASFDTEAGSGPSEVERLVQPTTATTTTTAATATASSTDGHVDTTSLGGSRWQRVFRAVSRRLVDQPGYMLAVLFICSLVGYSIAMSLVPVMPNCLTMPLWLLSADMVVSLLLVACLLAYCCVAHRTSGRCGMQQT